MSALDTMVLAAQPALLADGCVAECPVGDESEWRFGFGDDPIDLSTVTGCVRILSEIGGDVLWESAPRMFDEKPRWWQFRRRRQQGFAVTIPTGLPLGVYPWAMSLSDGEQKVQVWGPANSTLTVKQVTVKQVGR